LDKTNAAGLFIFKKAAPFPLSSLLVKIGKSYCFGKKNSFSTQPFSVKEQFYILDEPSFTQANAIDRSTRNNNQRMQGK
jgi:hypothetical protein